MSRSMFDVHGAMFDMQGFREPGYGGREVDLKRLKSDREVGRSRGRFEEVEERLRGVVGRWRSRDVHI